MSPQDASEIGAAALDERDRALLNAVQRGVPLVERPFAEIGRDLGMGEPDVVARLARLRDGRVIRQISAIFDSRSLGYQTSLVAMRVSEADEERAAEIVNAHPGVSHNYQRNHAFNMWFTMTVHRRRDLNREVERLAEAAGAGAVRLLPTLKMYKIRVALDVSGEVGAAAREEVSHRPRIGDMPPLTVSDVLAVRELQRDMPLESEPFAPMAEHMGIHVSDLLARARALRQCGRMRRFAAVLRHRTAGFAHNAMSVWKVPEGTDADACGRAMAGFRAVSHVYRRPTYPDWPYDLFGMIHGRRREDCEAVAEAIRAETGLSEYELLYSTREWKKVRVSYFTEADLSLEEMTQT